MRKIQFQNDYYYHIYNRGVDQRNIFLDQKDYIRFLTSMREFNRVEPIGSLHELRNSVPKLAKANLGTEFLIKIIVYCLNQNHYHFLIQQKKDKGVEKFMHKLGVGYTNYFNKKYNRSGALFQGKFKAISVKKDGYLLKLSCYINCNAQIHKIIKRAEDWTWSSYKDYLNLRNGTLCDKQIILRQFKDINEYQKLTNEVIKESSELKDYIKKYSLE